MKLVAALLLTVGLAACTRADAEHGQKADVTQTQVVAASTPAPAASMAEPAEPPGSCGDEGGSCGGSCGGGCMAEMDKPEPAMAPVPADAVWTEMAVTGMHCGGCARRIKNALVKVDGVLGVEVDLGTHTVKVATAKGTDGRALAAPAITALGYGVPGV
jgi:copper chaperone CopZ